MNTFDKESNSMHFYFRANEKGMYIFNKNFGLQ
jgi:hypothetical protein